MKNKIKQIKIKIKGCLLVKLAKARKDVRVLRERVADDAVDVQKYVDERASKDRLIRDLLLMLDEDTRNNWLKENNYERYFDKKKRIKK